ncbi:hypothetical protein HHL11_06970 [Ramlibacter sp. G-1-2-2]|uniref:RHS repeat protein n=1 Tax=Ramlibacter agri TaxID=2728837 RepID=A0A848GY29_9BURK|nr:LamG-like jellyroll fold domain-containing protein [Ramlibacter agri]NML43485.1 hypothetical protein [Ramlibacter agri]
MTMVDTVRTKLMPPFCLACALSELDLFKLFSVGDPIYPLTGAMKHRVSTGINLAGLSLSLTYDSTDKMAASQVDTSTTLSLPSAFGALWQANVFHRLKVSNGQRSALVSLGDGYLRNFSGNGAGTFTSSDGNPNKLVVISGGYRYTDVDMGVIETFDSSGNITSLARIDGTLLTFSYSGGNLVSVLDANGRTVSFLYDGSNRVSQIVGPDGSGTTVAYDAAGNLKSLTWADGKVATFMYENTGLPWALTGILDENSNRAATFTYDPQGRALSTERAGGVDHYEVQYTGLPHRLITETADLPNHILYRVHEWYVPESPVVIAQPNGEQSTWQGASVQGVPMTLTQYQSAGSGSPAATKSITPDANGNVGIRDDYQGNRTCYAYDALRRETLRIEGLDKTVDCAALSAGGALPTGARKIATTWHPNWRLQATSTQPLKKTTYVYNGQADPFNGGAVASCTTAAAMPDGTALPLLCKQVEQALLANGSADTSVTASSNSFAYDAGGHVTSSVDPRGKTTTMTYYATTAYTRSGSAIDDPYLDSVSLLLHGDGRNGGVSPIDSSASQKSFTSNSGAQSSTAQSKFGGTSLYFNGSGAYFSAPNSPDFRFGTGDFTVEFQMYLPIAWTSQSGSSGVVGQRQSDGTAGWVIYRNTTTPSRISARLGAGAADLVSLTTPATGVWQHWALTRRSGVCTWWVDGVQDASASCTANLNDTSGGFWIGRAQTWGGVLNGYIDELRITSGVARYTTNFTPPAAPFPDAVTLDPSSIGNRVGDVKSVADALGHVTQISLHDQVGRVRQSIDPKGVVTDITYTPRGLVKTFTSTPPGGPGRVMTYTYDGVGQLTQVDQPDGTHLSFTYDGAGRMTGASDARGNSVTYTLDASGNRVSEEVKDSSGVLRRAIGRSFDGLNRLQQVTGSQQ